MLLSAHTFYSLKYGTLSPENLAKYAAGLGVKTLSITDINNTSSSYAFYQSCKKYNIKPVYGIDFRQVKENSSGKVDHREFLYLGLAKNAEGIRELNALLSSSSLDGVPLPLEAPPMENCYIIYRKIPKGITKLRENEFIGVRPTEVNKLYSSYLKDFQNKLVIYAPVTFADEDGWKTHKLMRCIDLNIVVGKLDPKDCANTSEKIYTPESLKPSFPSILCSLKIHNDYWIAVLSKCKRKNQTIVSTLRVPSLAIISYWTN